ncbi:MAG: trigger factor [Firmicutes bacterium]|nr:trigger factor [Bacillota bacterium]
MEKEVIIKIEGEDWKEALDKAFKKLNKTAKIDGFRPGKAPKDVFIKKYGMSSLYMEAAESCLDKAYEEMIEQNKDEKIVAQPEINVSAVTDDYVEFKFTLTLKPEVELGKYTGLKVKKEEVKVTDEEVMTALNSMRERYIENVDKDGEVALGDVAIIDFEGFKDGVAFDGGKGENYSLKIGSNTFIPGFEEKIIGMKKGETKDLELTFPEDYHSEDLKGAEVVFKVTVNEIKEQKLPELDEDFFEDLGMEGIDSEETLKNQLKENILSRKEAESENKYIDELLAKASENMKVEIPNAMIKDELDRMISQYEEHLKMQGITLDMFYQFTASNEDALRSQMTEEATNRIKHRLLLEAIVEKENIEITDEDAEKEAADLASKYQMEKDEFLKAFGGLEMIKYDLKMRKAIEILKK